MRRAGILLVGLLLAFAPAAQAQVIAEEFSTSYSLSDLDAPPGVPPSFGGLTLKAGTTDRLLIGGAANRDDGALNEIEVVRDDAGHITGFSGDATRYADAAFNDGGVTYGPDGVLFLARWWPANELGQSKPGSVLTDKIVPMTPFGVADSLASLQFVPAGMPGEGSLKLASYSGGEWYDAEVGADGNGTFDVVGVTPLPESTLPGGPEGFVFVGAGSPGFDGPTLLISEWDAGNVAAYDVDANGDPILSTRRDFITGLEGAEGAFIDPLTGDLLFSTFGGSDQVIVVRGFAKPVSLQVRTNVINDHGGVLAAEDVTVHVRGDRADVLGSPQPGSETGALYDVEEGKSYTVFTDPEAHYTTSIGGDCAADGTVVVKPGVQPLCTITLDDDAATLTVVTRVINDDDGGSAVPSSFAVHVRRGGVDVLGSPRPGSASGTTYTLAAGAHVVSSDALSGYTTAISGDCAGDGSVALSVGQHRNCTIAADDVAPPPKQELPPPEPGENVNAVPKSGTVKIKLKGTKRFVELEEGQQVPVGSVIDTTRGRVTLVAASDKSGGTATADFYAGIFRVGQTGGARPITTLKLVEKLSCGRGRASAAGRRKKKRRLWGDGSGRFRTDGSYSSATVRGTRWLVEDRCTSTLTRVAVGRVAVRDRVERKSLIVRAGKQYVARRRF